MPELLRQSFNLSDAVGVLLSQLVVLLSKSSILLLGLIEPFPDVSDDFLTAYFFSDTYALLAGKGSLFCIFLEFAFELLNVCLLFTDLL